MRALPDDLSDRLIESVPNVSEGRRLDVVDRLAGAVSSVPGVHLLDRTSDASHNRSVLTIAGPAGSVSAALEELVAAAVRDIDMDEHSGEHPRIGAVDVVPFVPLGDTTMDEASELARRFGAASPSASTAGLPVRPGGAADRSGEARRRPSRPIRGPEGGDRPARPRAGPRAGPDAPIRRGHRRRRPSVPHRLGCQSRHRGRRAREADRPPRPGVAAWPRSRPMASPCRSRSAAIRSKPGPRSR